MEGGVEVGGDLKEGKREVGWIGSGARPDRSLAPSVAPTNSAHHAMPAAIFLAHHMSTTHLLMRPSLPQPPALLPRLVRAPASLCAPSFVKVKAPSPPSPFATCRRYDEGRKQQGREEEREGGRKEGVGEGLNELIALRRKMFF